MNEIYQSNVLVLGGGITGMTAAARLAKQGVDVRVLEAGDDVGGCMRSERQEGFLLEKGPFNVIVRDPAFVRLVDEERETLRLTTANEEAGKRRFVYHDGQIMQVPSGPGALLTTPLLSLGGRLRLLRGLVCSAPPSKPEETIDEAARRRLGPQTASRLVSAMVNGIYGADSRDLSLSACFPTIGTIDRQTRSPLLAGICEMKKAKANIDPNLPARPKGLVSFKNGLGSLPNLLADRVGRERVHLNTRAIHIESIENGYRVTARCGVSERKISFETKRMVLALPVRATASLLKPLQPEAAAILTDIPNSTLVVLNLGYLAEDIAHDLHGYGFLVPRGGMETPVLGVLWADSTFPHYAPGERRLLRVFLGGENGESLAEKSDRELMKLVRPMLAELLGVSGAPIMMDVCRHAGAIPQYRLGHTERIERFETHIETLPDFFVTGNFLRGISINDCVREGTAVAERIITDDRTKGGSVEGDRRSTHHANRFTRANVASAH